MKKFKKILIILIGLTPLIISAEENEMKWRWYTLIEKNVHYESDVENICEDFDKNNYMLTDWTYSLSKPEEKDYREIQIITKELNIERKWTNKIKVQKLVNDSRIIKISELAILDENGDKVSIEVIGRFFSEEDSKKILDDNFDTFINLYSDYDFEIKFYKPVDIEKISIQIVYAYDESFLGLEFSTYLSEETITNNFAAYSTKINKNCENNLCTIEIKVDKNNMLTDDVIFNLNTYKYRDKLFKCFTKEKLYVPGYFADLEGFIKDEENYEIIKTETIPAEKPKYNYIFRNPVNSKLEPDVLINDEDIKPNIEKDEPLAIVTKEKKENNNDLIIYKISLTSLLILAVLITITKIVKKRRTN